MSGRQLMEASQVSPSAASSLPHHCSLLPKLLGLQPHMLDEIARDIQELVTLPGAMRPDELPPLQRLGAQFSKKGKSSICQSGCSKSLLQEAFVRLHRLLFSWKLLPLSSFGEYRHPKHGNQFDKTAISRRAFVLFNRLHGNRVARGSACLAWDSRNHLASIPGCSLHKSWYFVYKPIRTPEVDSEKRSLSADLSALAESASAGKLDLASQGVPAFDLILCEEVLEHVPEPFAATRALLLLLRPGGHVFVTAPFNARHHLQWDYFRYTVAGARELFSRAGFNVLLAQKVGDTMSASGFMLGFGTGDLPAEYERLDTANGTLFRPFDAATTPNTPAEWMYLGVAMIARKPLKPLAPRN